MNTHHDAAGQKRIITICDEDPVLRLTAIALRGANEDDRAWISRYFSPEACPPERIERIGEHLRGAEVRTLAAAEEKELARHSAGSTALICRRASIGEAELAASPALKTIRRLGADPAGIDVEAVGKRGVELRCIERPTLALTAEHGILLMLAGAKNLVEADRRTRAADWDHTLVHPVNGVAYNWPGMTDLGGLYGCTIGLVGLGQVGLLVAERLRAFRAKVIYSKPSPLPAEREAELGVRRVSHDDLLATADIVSLHARWTPETEKLMDAKAFARMKRGSIFINTSRGALVDEDALADALESGHLGFAALDAHAPEPRPAGTRLARLPNTILTPHIAGGSRLGLLREVEALLEGL